MDSGCENFAADALYKGIPIHGADESQLRWMLWDVLQEGRDMIRFTDLKAWAASRSNAKTTV
jgi:hypothetical protein